MTKHFLILVYIYLHEYKPLIQIGAIDISIPSAEKQRGYI